MNNTKVKRVAAAVLAATSLMSTAAVAMPMGLVVNAATLTAAEAKAQTTVDIVVGGTANNTIVQNSSYTIKVNTPKNSDYYFTFYLKKPGESSYTLQYITEGSSNSGNANLITDNVWNGTAAATGTYSYKVAVTNRSTGTVYEMTGSFESKASTKIKDNAVISDTAGNTYIVKSAANRTLILTGIKNKGSTSAAYEFGSEPLTLLDTTVATTSAPISNFTIIQFGDGTNPVANLYGTPYKQINVPSTVETISANAINSALIKDTDEKNKGVIILGSDDKYDLFSGCLKTIAANACTANVPNIIFRSYHTNVTGTSYTNTFNDSYNYQYTASLPTGANVELPFGSWAFLLAAEANQYKAKNYNLTGVSGYDFRNGVVDKVSGKKMFWTVAMTSNAKMTDTSVPGYTIHVENCGTPGTTGGYYTNTIPFDIAKKYIKRTVDFEGGDDFNTKTFTLTPRTSSGLSGSQWFNLGKNYDLNAIANGTVEDIRLVDVDEQAVQRYCYLTADKLTDDKTALKSGTVCNYFGQATVTPVIEMKNMSDGNGFLTLNTVNRTSKGTLVTANEIQNNKEFKAGTKLETKTITLSAGSSADTLFKGTTTHKIRLQQDGVYTSNASTGSLVRVNWDNKTKTATPASNGSKIAVQVANVNPETYYKVTLTDIVTKESTTIWDGFKLGKKGFDGMASDKYMLNYKTNKGYKVDVTNYFTLAANHAGFGCLMDRTINYPTLDGNNYLQVYCNGVTKQSVEVPYNSNANIKFRFYGTPGKTTYTCTLYERYYNASTGKYVVNTLKTNQALTAVDAYGQYSYDFTSKFNDFKNDKELYAIIKDGSTVINTINFSDSKTKFETLNTTPNNATATNVTAAKIAVLSLRGPELKANKNAVNVGDTVDLSITTHNFDNSNFVADRKNYVLQRSFDGTNWSDVTTDANNAAINFESATKVGIKSTTTGLAYYRIKYNFNGISTTLYSNPVYVATGVVTGIQNNALLGVPNNSFGTTRLSGVASSYNSNGTAPELTTYCVNKVAGDFTSVPLDSTGVAVLNLGNSAKTAPITAKEKTATGTNLAQFGDVPKTTYTYELYPLTYDSTAKKITAIAAASTMNATIRAQLNGNTVKDSNGNIFDYSNSVQKLNINATGYYMLVATATVTNPSTTTVTSSLAQSYTQRKVFLFKVANGAFKPKYSVSSTQPSIGSNVTVRVTGFADAGKHTGYSANGFKLSGTTQSYNLDLSTTADANKPTKLNSMLGICNVSAKLVIPAGLNADGSTKTETITINQLTKDDYAKKDYAATVSGGTTSAARFVTDTNVYKGIEFSFGGSQIRTIVNKNTQLDNGKTVTAQLYLYSTRSGGQTMQTVIPVKFKKG